MFLTYFVGHGIVRNSRFSFVLAGLLCFTFAVQNYFSLSRHGTVATVTDDFLDQLHSAWYWQVGSLVVTGVLLLWESYDRADHKRVVEFFRLRARLRSLEYCGSQRSYKWERFKQSPVVAQLFVLCGLGAILLEFSILFFSFSRPVTALQTAVVYLSPMLIASSLFSEKPMFAYRRLLFLCTATLAFMGMIPFATWYFLRDLGDDSALMRIRIIAPFFWAAMLMSPAMLRWTSVRQQPEYQPAQASIADLAYFTSVASVAVAAWMALL